MALFMAAPMLGGDASAQQGEPRVAARLPDYRCMMLTAGRSQGTGAPSPVLAMPRVDDTKLGVASDPVIAAHPLSVVNGYAGAACGRADGMGATRQAEALVCVGLTAAAVPSGHHVERAPSA